MRMANDPWNSNMKINDKIAHFACFYFALIIGIGIYCYNPLWFVPMLVVMGLIKEFYDSKYGDGFSYKDLIMDFMGIGFGLALLYNWMPDSIIWMTLLFLFVLLNRQNIRLPFMIRK